MHEEKIVLNEMNDQVALRLEQLMQLKREQQDPFEQTSYEVSHHCKDIQEQFETLEGQRVSLAGRLRSQRGMGKASFCDLQDLSGQLQLFTKIDLLGEENYAAWQALDIGDWIGVEGEVMRTRRGEVSVRVEKWVLLAKCLRPLPEKFHGLKDTDTRYRQRYLDLTMNEDSRQRFLQRSRIIQRIRQILDEAAFMEVETPVLNTIAGGAAARPFITHHNTLDMQLYLRIAPELYLKRLIVGGLERVYEIARCFRNEGMDVSHNPEFTMMELYQAYADYEDMMDLAERIIVEAAKTVKDDLIFHWNENEIRLDKPFRRLSMRDAILNACGVDFYEVQSLEEARALAKEKGIELEEQWDLGEVINAFFEQLCEAELIQPTFIYDYPSSISPLAKRKPGQPDWTERFELFIGGYEFGNAYSELNDPLDQRARFEDQVKKREAGNSEASEMDEDYCRALEYGLPPTGGLGIGIDRLVMLLTETSSIRDVLLFPTMRKLSTKVQLSSEDEGEEEQA